MENLNTIDICVVTYNRLCYLQKCITSIFASTKVKYRLIVLSDCSTDGTNEWLKEMEDCGKIDLIIINKTNIGSAKSFNRILSEVKTDWFVMACDDIYFHRGWDENVIETINTFNDAGLVSFFNYTRLTFDKGVEKVSDKAWRLLRTGLGATAIKTELFNQTNGFVIPGDFKMGYFTTPFCIEISKVNMKRNKHYITIPSYATLMDHHVKLTERKNLSEYEAMRRKEKNHK